MYDDFGINMVNKNRGLVGSGLQDETRTRVWLAALPPLPKNENFRGPRLLWVPLRLISHEKDYA